MSELESELAALKARVAELEARAKPPAPFIPEDRPRFDPTARASMSPSMMREFANVIPDLRDDLRNRPYSVAPSSPLKETDRPKTSASLASQNQTGWRDAAPLDVPGGARTHQLIEQGANSYLPHGPGNPVQKKSEKE